MSDEEWSDDLLPRSTKANESKGTFMSSESPQPPIPETKPPKSHKRLIILLVALVILMGLGIGGWFAYQKYSSQISFLWKQSVDENDQIVEDMKNKAEIAQKEVRKKYPDAYLEAIAAEVKEGATNFDEDTQMHAEKYNVDVENNYVFFFDSIKYNKQIDVLIKININEDRITKIIEDPFDKNDRIKPEIPIGEVKIGYQKVLEIFDENGGAEFRKQNKGVKQNSPTLQIEKLIKNNPLNWRMVYYTGNPNDIKNLKTKFLLINIDAKNGNIINKKEN